MIIKVNTFNKRIWHYLPQAIYKYKIINLRTFSIYIR